MTKLITGPSDWRGSALAASSEWIHDWTPSEIAEIEAAFAAACERGKTLETLEREDFPLPQVSRLFAMARERLEAGCGLQLFRGFPTERHGKDELRLIYWGMGKHLGAARSQSRVGDLLGDVKNFGVVTESAGGRGYQSNQRLNFHTDSCDVTGLFVLHTAKSGGLSKLASSVAVRNEIARRRPDLLEVLYQPFFWSWNKQEPPGEKPYYPQPIFSECEGSFSCRYIDGQIKNAQAFPDVPRFTPAQIEARALIDTLANSEEFNFSMMFEPGDLQLVNNHTCFHARTAFEDWPDPERCRHLLRMWLSVPNSRPLSPLMGTIYQDQRRGVVRGGFPSRTGQHVFNTYVMTD
ncbi:MAG: TauD/TfdA family dioxygenase [Stellaceae bacterium]